jgi:hypothetical protein
VRGTKPTATRKFTSTHSRNGRGRKGGTSVPDTFELPGSSSREQSSTCKSNHVRLTNVRY